MIAAAEAGGAGSAAGSSAEAAGAAASAELSGNAGERAAGAGAGAAAEVAGTEAAGMGAGSGGASGMQPSAAGAGSGAAGMAAMPECSTVGALRCSPEDSSKRQRCSDGMWREAEPCGEDEICAAASMPNPGSCIATADVCRNRNGMAACDDAGVLYQCGEAGVVRGVMRCGSRELCMPGLMTRTCAKCVPGAYRCTGAVLEQCDPAGTAFYESRRCDSPELCQESEGKCAEAICNPGQKTCMGDVLQECRQDRSGFQRMRECGPGQCDANAGTCRACMPGAARCVGNMLMTCDPQGVREESEDCMPGRCDGNKCVDCVGNESRSCGDHNMGECRIGTQMCRNGNWSDCTGKKDPTPELCNGKDDDCNGMLDDNVTDCPTNQVCMNGKCGCRSAGDCKQGEGEICVAGSCVKPYAQTCGSCPAGLTCDHGLCVPQCGNGCPNLPGFNGIVSCGRDVQLGDACVLVCQAAGNPLQSSCPQNTTCREVGSDGVSICQGR
jgi:hypothetical protein